jgi:prepilin-type N-terminal cleavage/methylation domain-containing protein
MRRIDRHFSHPALAEGRGFTLIEILIVVSIIAVLASLILAGVNIARKRAAIAIAQSNIEALNNALEQYVADTGRYPGEKIKDYENGFPALFDAICGEKPPKGKGGPNSPYMKFKEAEVYVFDFDEDKYRPAYPEEIYDPKVEKYLADPWGVPYIYHENKSRARKPYMHKNTADIYSCGPDKKDQTIDGEKTDTDDIGNW